MSHTASHLALLPGIGFSLATENSEGNLAGKRKRPLAAKRAVSDLLTLLDNATDSSHFIQLPGLQFERDGHAYEVPRYQFVGPCGGDDAMRIGVFGTIHGDEPESGLGVVRFLQELMRNPEAARGFVIHAYPVCNPTGYEGGTREARGGK